MPTLIPIAPIILVASGFFGQDGEATFWKWFQAHDRALLAAKTRHEPVCAELLSRLKKMNPDLDFEFGPVQAGKREFVLTVAGIKASFPAVISLAQAAPDMPHWTITRFRPPRPGVMLVRWKGIKLDARTVEFIVTQDDGDTLGLAVSVTGFEESRADDYEEAVYLLLDRLLGEYTVEMKIRGLQVTMVQGRAGGHWMSLTHIKDLIKIESPR
ncbi:MAG TPA: hypothetical protein VEZ90_02485 [Blastocatellia bacterium]|nr:hypothetical protein [Blastocatellia bacterium]